MLLLVGPAIEPENEASREIRYYLDLANWDLFDIEVKRVKDLVRPVKWNPQGEELGEMMDEAEFYSKYQRYAAPRGLLPDDIHPRDENPSLVLMDYAKEEEELVKKEKAHRDELKGQLEEAKRKKENLEKQKEALNAQMLEIGMEEDEDDEDEYESEDSDKSSSEDD